MSSQLLLSKVDRLRALTDELQKFVCSTAESLEEAKQHEDVPKNTT